MDIETAKKFFTLSVAAFDFANKVRAIFSAEPHTESEMETLHREALLELEKERPDEELVFNLLCEMEELAKKCHVKPAGFASGGIISQNQKN